MPITTNDPILADQLQRHDHSDIGSTIPIEGGGTGAVTSESARNALDVPSLDQIMGHTHDGIDGKTIPITGGGTGSITIEEAQAALGLLDINTLLNHNHTDNILPVSGGGTGVTSLSDLANAMDLEIEYGTFTPYLEFDNGATMISGTYTRSIWGYYYKIGRLVRVGWKCRYTVNTMPWLSKDDYVKIAGMPYVSSVNVFTGTVGTIVIPGFSTSSLGGYIYYIGTSATRCGVMEVFGLNKILCNTYSTGTYYFDGAITYLTY